LTHLESIENDVELDSVLSPDGVVHLAGIRRDQQDSSRDEEKQHPQDGEKVCWWDRPDGHTTQSI